MPGFRDVRKKVVVVTGAGSGIGRSIACAFAREGATLVVSDIDENRLNSVADELGKYGVVAPIAADVSDFSQVTALADYTLQTFGHVDILVNNAGIGWGGPSDRFPLDDFQKVMAVNFWGVIHGVQAFLPAMKHRRSGHIVNIASMAGLTGMVGLSAYSASKYAVVGYSEVLKSELRRFNIGVTAICPGIINTNVVKDGKSTGIEDMKASHSAMIGFYQKWGWPPERVARSVVRAVRRNRFLVPVGPEAWFLWYLKRVSQKLWEICLMISGRMAF